MAVDGEILVKTEIDNQDVQRELQDLKKDIRKFTQEVGKYEAAKLPLTKQLEEYGVALDRAKAKLHELQQEKSRITAITSGAADATPDQAIEAFSREKANLAELQAQTAEVDALQRKWDATAAKVDDYNVKLTAARDNLEYSTTRAGELTAAMTGVGGMVEKASGAVNGLKQRFVELGKKMGRVAGRALIFSVMYAALSKFKNLVSSYIQKDEQLQNALRSMKSAWLTAFQPIWEVIQPALLVLMNILTAVANLLSRVFSFFSGKSTDEMAKNAKAMNSEEEAIAGVGGAAEDAAKSLAGFDELNKLEEQQPAGGGGGAATEVSGGEGGAFGGISQEIKDELLALQIYVSGALLALGAILLFTGVNIPLGLGLIVAGLVGIVDAVSESGDKMSPAVKKALTNLMIILGAAMLAIGAILTFTGVNIPLGIGLMIAGLGAMVGAVALNWNSINEKMKGPLGTIFQLLMGFLLVLGIILLLTGAALPLGLGLIVVGAVGLVASIALKWGTMTDKVKPEMDDIFRVVSAGLLVLGIILACTGVALPLGIALIAAGAVGLVKAEDINWDSILDSLQGVWQSIKDWWDRSVAKYFTLDYWNEKLQPIKDAIQSIGDMFSTIGDYKDQVNQEIWYGGTLSLGIEGSPSVAVSSVPALAQGAVIPANREFLAILGDQKNGTNIETPLATMVQAFRQAMNEGGYGGQRTVVLQVDRRELGRVTFDVYNEEAQRIGVSLGGA